MGGADRSGSRFAALIAAWLLTAYYMRAWFTIFFAALFALCWGWGRCWMSGRNGGPAHCWAWRGRHWATLACTAAAFALFVTPFLITYLPKSRETGGQDYWQMLGYLVTPIDLINVGPDNYLWGWLFRPLLALVHAVLPSDPDLPNRVLRGEHETGFAPILFVLAVTAAWRIVVRRSIGGDRPASAELRAFALATIILWVLTLQLWVLSPWGLVFELVPAAQGPAGRLARAIVPRAPGPAAGRRGLARPGDAISQAQAMAGGGAARPARRRTAQCRIARAAQPFGPAPRSLGDLAPPAGCRSFYVVSARPGEPLYRNAEMNARYPHNVDAMFLAERWRVPTINGDATFTPPDWRFTNPLAADYDARARA